MIIARDPDAPAHKRFEASDLSGIQGKSAVGITSLAEGLTCLVGVLTYFALAHKTIDWSLAPIVVVGAVCSVPFTAKTVKRINAKSLKIAIAILTVILGAVTLIKLFK